MAWLAFFPVLTILVLLAKCGNSSHKDNGVQTPQNVETMVMILMSQTPTETVTLFPTETQIPTLTPLVVSNTPEPTLCASPSCGCIIKGNINSEGKKIYHCPNSPNYKETEINKRGERYFCTEQEAIEAGFERTSNTSYCGFN